MSLGPAVRKLLSPQAERKAAGIYRAIFVDLEKVCRLLGQHLPPDAHLLDIGGGDGELLNHLLDHRRDVTVTMVDVAPSVGKFITPANRPRVSLHPGTPIETHARGAVGYDAALVSDVIHHLPIDYRSNFLRSVHGALAEAAPLLVKDIEPGHPIAHLSLFCDKYISGDRGVELVSMEDLRILAERTLPAHTVAEVGLHAIDRPNYLLKFAFRDDAVRE